MKNKYKIEGDIVKIYLKHKRLGEKVTIVDVESLDRLIKENNSWHLYIGHYGQFYVRCTKYMGMVDGKPKYTTIYLHRMLTDCTDKEKHVDHINHDTLDNRLSNLRIVTVQQNSRHRKSENANSSTGVRNVSYDTINEKYIVQFQVEGRNKVYGRFDTLEEAEKVAEMNRAKYY